MKLIKLLIVSSFLLAPFSLFASPIECFRKTVQDRLFQDDGSLASRLCRKAKPQAPFAPYECFIYAYRKDFNLSFNMTIDLCQGTTEMQEPRECFDSTLKAFPGIRHIIASTLCSASTNSKTAIECFKASTTQLQLVPEIAATLCAQ